MVTQTVVDTFQADIFIGAQEGYTGKFHTKRDVIDICQLYCDQVGLCVTVTRTTFVYRKGKEPGFIVGLINYPRFPSTPDAITHHAKVLGQMLKLSLKQIRVTIVTNKDTVMLGDLE